MLRVCIISCGMIANAAHIPAYRTFPGDFEIVGVSDISAAAAESTAAKNGIPHWYTDAGVMLRELSPDVVSVCVPNRFHKEYTMLALSSGANVLCEKPLAMTVADAREMFDFAARQGKVLMACQSMRFTPDRLAAKKYIEEHGENDFYYMELSRIRRRGIPFWGSFHKKAVSGGGAFLDIGVHMLDAAIWLSGRTDPVSVLASTKRNHPGELGDLVASGALTGHVDSIAKFHPEEMDVEDFGAGTVRFSDGAIMNFKVAWATNLPEASDITLVNRHIGISLPSCRLYSGVNTDCELPPLPEAYPDSHFPGHIHLVRNLREVLTGRENPIVKPAETIAVSAILEAFYRSAESGREAYIQG